MAGGGLRQSRRKHLKGKEESASAAAEILGMKKEEEALDLIRAAKEDSVSATAEIHGMKKKEEALDLIRVGKGDSASSNEIPLLKEEALDLTRAGKEEEALDLTRAGKERAEEATSEIIRTKKKEVLDLLLARKRMYGASSPAGTADTEEKNVKRKKVVKRMFSQAFIDFLMSKKPRDVTVPDDVVAKFPKGTRDIYDINVAIANKSLEYEKAVLDQYMELGYAVFENEVTDDEMED